MDDCLVDMAAAADASVDPIATPTSAAPRALRSLIPSPQYMQVLPRPCNRAEPIYQQVPNSFWTPVFSSVKASLASLLMHMSKQ